MPRPDWDRLSRKQFLPRLKTTTLQNLRVMERLIEDRIADCQRFYPWPALEESLAQDLTAIWNEQKLRTSQQK